MVAIDGRIDLSQYNLSVNQKDALKKAKTPEQVVEAIGGDGAATAEEQKLIDEIVQEMTASSDGTVKFKDGEFEASAGIKFNPASNLKDQVSQKVESVMRLALEQKTGTRDKLLDRLDSVGDVKKALSIDMAQSAKFKDDRFTAGKILMQDSNMLTRLGLVNSEDQTFLSKLEKRVADKRLSTLTPPELERLKEIVAKAQQVLEGQPDADQVSPKYRINDASLSEGSYTGLNENFEALMASSDAAINDANLSVGESGLNSDQMKEQHAKGVQGGASFSRIGSAVREADRQIANLNKAQATLEKQIPELSAEIEKRSAEVKAAGEDPDKDEILNGLKASLQTSGARLKAIIEKRGQLGETKINTLAKAKQYGVIVSEFDKRMMAIQSAQGKLSRGCQTLEHLNKWAEGLAVDAAKHVDDKDAPLYLQAKRDGAGKALEMAKQSADDMVTAVEDLLKTYETSPTANKKAIELLKKEVETLKTVKAEMSGANVKDKIKDLTAARERIIAAMDPMVKDGTIDYREVKALKTFDATVTDYAGKASTTGANIKGYIGDIEGMLKEAKTEKSEMDKQSSKGFEMIKKFVGDTGIAYGTHVAANLNVTVGVGNQYVGIGAGITAGIKIEKTLAGDPNRELQLSVNVGVMAEAHASLGKFFNLDVEFKAAIQGGLAFATVDDAKKFMQRLADGASAITDGDMDKAKAAMQEMKDIVAGKGFAGTITSGKVKISGGDKHHPPYYELSGKKETSTKNYGDGATGVEKTFTAGGKVEWAHGKGLGVKYTERATTFTDKTGHGHQEKTQTVSVAFPVHMVEGLLEKVKLGKIKSFGHGMDDGMKQALQMALSKFGGNLDMLNNLTDTGPLFKKLADACRMAKVSGESEIMIGFERHYHMENGKEVGHDYFEIGLEGEYSAEATVSSGSAYAKVKGEASYELAMKIPAPHFPVFFSGTMMDYPATEEKTQSSGGHH